MIVLTTPWNPGDANPGVTYPHVTIVEFHFQWAFKYVQCWMQYGERLGSGVWAGGTMVKQPALLKGTEYGDLITILPDDLLTPIYVAAYLKLYDQLINLGYFSGTVVV